jgi:hypothetical protein
MAGRFQLPCHYSSAEANFDQIRPQEKRFPRDKDESDLIMAKRVSPSGIAVANNIFYA